MLARSSCVRLSDSLSLRPSVKSRWSTKTAKPRITQTTTYGNPGNLAFWRQKCRRNSNGVTLKGFAK